MPMLFKQKISTRGMTPLSLCCAAGFLFGIGFVAGVYFFPQSPRNEISEVHETNSSSSFINPLLACDQFSSVSNRQLNSIKAGVSKYLSSAQKENNIQMASVYFRDLNNGPWFGIDEKETFIPGSLLKVPFLISLFKLAEQDTAFLKKGILYEGGRADYAQQYPPSVKIEEGKEYTIGELIERMIKYSDNDATLLLSQMISTDQIRASYIELGIDSPEDSNYVITVRTYASFFRILFNATYLNQEMSARALSLLSQSEFKDGLRAGVPKEIVISHKFGERWTNGNEPSQLHDCGIVYYPNHPYLLCVMVRGKSFDQMSTFIKDVSKIVYTEVDKGL
ncbi:MAG: hypothetical protein A2664_00065 [Candidatus Taylorbacteria bacterium RIFCSPHIGHO2_01_FULL_46_22b]|uniref:Beta-lactamase class A catalytic domain-containing protein n=1 Tax=Candidatus Taylorbacteria bacterium RIFCSPHIGHO2_01_FULL_46_22b TaxID=1802301 RepID=A0A1G2M1T6_9BACT|nr:MAG: hypothetical protein A2664_00065 [Candidatus Taylorbacteria bacterium RIFCSPHIGHO2_01_FULL_46_22b]